MEISFTPRLERNRGCAGQLKLLFKRANACSLFFSFCLVCASADNVAHLHCGDHFLIAEHAENLCCRFAALFLDQLVVAVHCEDALHMAPVQCFLVKGFTQFEVEHRRLERGRGQERVCGAVPSQLNGRLNVVGNFTQKVANAWKLLCEREWKPREFYEVGVFSTRESFL